jgi:hypothetical protein
MSPEAFEIWFKPISMFGARQFQRAMAILAMSLVFAWNAARLQGWKPMALLTAPKLPRPTFVIEPGKCYIPPPNM